jgi:hypothetical protein
MKDSQAIYFTGAVFLFCISYKEMNKTFNENMLMPHSLFNFVILGFSSGIMIDSIKHLLSEN